MKVFVPLIIAPLLLISTFNVLSNEDKIVVRNANDSGQGSLRAALLSGKTTVEIDASVGSIKLLSPLIVEDVKKLNILGAGQWIDGSKIVGNDHILSMKSIADLTVQGINFVGNAEEISQDPDKQVGGSAIYVGVPASFAQDLNVSLKNVSIARVGGHGVHVSDCSTGSICGGGNSAEGKGSSASIYVDLDSVSIRNVGYGRQDGDGFRVDERGIGSIYMNISNSLFYEAGADGMELDEAGSGDVVVNIDKSAFLNNGAYCDLVKFKNGSKCDDEGSPDLDDGFDIDEADEGSIMINLTNTDANHNYDEGFDFDEQGKGDIVFNGKLLEAASNLNEGIKVSEENGGSVRVLLSQLLAVDNNGSKEGVQIEEEGKGDLEVRLGKSTMIGGAAEKLKVEQADKGKGILKIESSNEIELDLKGVKVK